MAAEGENPPRELENRPLAINPRAGPRADDTSYGPVPRRSLVPRYATEQASTIQKQSRKVDTTTGPLIEFYVVPDTEPWDIVVRTFFYITGLMTNRAHTGLPPANYTALPLSALNAVWPEILAEATTYYSNKGFRVRQIICPRDLETELITLPAIEDCSNDVLWYNLAIIVLTMFKNIQAASFEGYFRQRRKAFRGKLAMADLPNDTSIFGLDQAKKFNVFLNIAYGVKRKVLYYILADKDDDHIGSLMTYLLQMLNYHEMATFMTITMALILPRSPVLRSSDLIAEVANLSRAVNAVAASPMPQFFRILASPTEYQMLERSRFPTLIDIAVEIMKVTVPSLGQLVRATTADRSTVIRKFVRMHRLARDENQYGGLGAVETGHLSVLESVEQ